MLELIASVIVTLSSTYFRFEKTKFEKNCEKNFIEIKNEKYVIEKKEQEKNILLILAIVTIILLIAAILEAIALSLI
ncbi:MAG: hypothetical protein LBJ32_03845 [Oscillospiraceae bacterium]|nr:hypothetical protein [Oscillospiraceae bacterium]